MIQSFGVDHPFLFGKVHTITARFAVRHRRTRHECLCTLAREVILWSVSDEVLWWERVSTSCEMFFRSQGAEEGAGEARASHKNQNFHRNLGGVYMKFLVISVALLVGHIYDCPYPYLALGKTPRTGCFLSKYA